MNGYNLVKYFNPFAHDTSIVIAHSPISGAYNISHTASPSAMLRISYVCEPLYDMVKSQKLLK